MSKVNLPTVKVRWEDVDYQKGVGDQDCEVPSVPSKRVSDVLGSPLLVPLSVMMLICTLTFLCNNCFVFLPNFTYQLFFPPMKQKWFTLFVCLDLGLDVVFQLSGHQQITCISVTLQQLHFHKQCLLYDTSVEFHNVRFLTSFVRSKSFICKVLSIASN